MNIVDVLVLSLGVGIPALVLFMVHKYSYWKTKNVPSVKPTPIIGNLKDVRKNNVAQVFSDIYNHSNGKHHPVIGFYIFFTPRLIIRDLELVKQILVKDFNKFSNRSATTDQKRDTLGWNNLFTIKNPKWKDLRSKLTPFFSSGKLKMMFPLIDEIGTQMDAHLVSLGDGNGESIMDARELTSSYTTDVIASVAFGVKANSLKNPDGDFRRHGRMVTSGNVFRFIEQFSIFFSPRLVSLLRAKQFSKKGSAFFRSAISFVMEQREITGVTRNDLIDILLDFKKSEDFDGDLDFLVAQAALFFSAGFHTSASALTFMLYELSRNEDIQQRLRDEIKEALKKTNGKILYDMLPEMGYLDMVLNETLRLYPTFPFLDRRCELPEGEKEYSLKPYIDFAIPHGMSVSIPFFAIQRDPKYFPNPLTFDPERFSPENKANIVPFSFIPFGSGPRACIGERLARIQTKVGLISILNNHRVTACDRTPKDIDFKPMSIIIQPKEDIFLKFIKDPLLN